MNYLKFDIMQKKLKEKLCLKDLEELEQIKLLEI